MIFVCLSSTVAQLDVTGFNVMKKFIYAVETRGIMLTVYLVDLLLHSSGLFYFCIYLADICLPQLAWDSFILCLFKESVLCKNPFIKFCCLRYLWEVLEKGYNFVNRSSVIFGADDPFTGPFIKLYQNRRNCQTKPNNENKMSMNRYALRELILWTWSRYTYRMTLYM